MNAFVLAAGRGERLKPLTETTPKPLVELGGRPLLSRIFDRLEALQVERVVVNAWHLKDQILKFCEEERSKRSFEILVSEEAELLGTGGGLKQAFKFLETPFYMMNGDCYWEGDLSSLTPAEAQSEAVWALQNARQGETKIALKSGRLVQLGDFFKSEEATGAGYVFTGIQRIEMLYPEELPDQGCIVRDYWIHRLKSGATIEGRPDVLSSWEDLGTMERLEAARMTFPN